MIFSFSTFSCPGGGTMRWATGANAQKNTVLILPGWGEWIEKYEELAAEWQARGYKAVIPEWRGQGLSSRLLEDRKKTWLPSVDVLIADLDAFFATQLVSERNLAIFAHSMGGHIVLRWLLERSSKGASATNIKAMILSSLMQRIVTRPIPYLLARPITALAMAAAHDKTYAIGQAAFDQTAIPFEKNLLTHDTKRYQAMLRLLRTRPELKVGGITYGWLNAVFRSAAQLEENLNKPLILPPTLFLASKDDPLVVFEAIRHIAGKIPGAQTAWFDSARHELLFETDAVRKRAWKEIDDFLKNQIPSPESRIPS